MKFNFQLYRHEPWNNIYGDCHRTCIANLLDLEPWQVPHFAQVSMQDASQSMEGLIEAWLEDKGFSQVLIHYQQLHVRSVLSYMAEVNDRIFYILSGQSPRGTNHSVIACGGEIVHDPAPRGGGLVGPMDNGVFEACFLTPIQFVSLPRERNL